ncbi:hypothetical protein MXD58_020330, partial [Frankia sp. AgKG'84/4]
PQAPAEGGPADFVLVDVQPWRHLLGHPAWPVADILAAAAGPAHVMEVWVAGRRVRTRADAPVRGRAADLGGARSSVAPTDHRPLGPCPPAIREVTA